ncbi:hypothetical protein GWK08_12215 [Leptobacterium flavescens]|uniref:Nuclear transport factor 2 family protein n=1 Tax=Leptobacterium flavescens TaxID=472055 RepID=A0A6P0UR24_9FLAO|nr:hypothetical protein [Leptobacterium flavescens]NER14209.1 hypothetical protein [Leptobacterium flavescens]
MKKITLLLLFLAVSFATAQTTKELEESALRDAKAAADATLKFDFENVLKYTHPKIIEASGGKDALINVLESTFATMKSQGFVFEKAEVNGVSNVVFEQDEYRCIIEGYNQMKLDGKRISSKSYLFGFYNKEQKHWYFLEAARLKNAQLVSVLLPDFKTDIEIPEDEIKTEDIE